MAIWLFDGETGQGSQLRRASTLQRASRISHRGLVSPCENGRLFRGNAERKVQSGNDLASLRADDWQPAKVLCEPADTPRASSVQRASHRRGLTLTARR